MPELPAIFARTRPAELESVHVPQGGASAAFDQLAEGLHSIQRVNDAVEYSNIKNLIDLRQENAKEFINQVKNNPDDWNKLNWDQMTSAFNTEFEEKDREFLKQIPSRYQPHMVGLLASQRKANFNQFANVWSELAHDYHQGQYFIRQQRGLQDAAQNANDPGLLEAIKNTLVADTKATAHAGWIKQEKMAEDLINVPSAIAQMPALRTINSNEPDKFFDDLNKGKYSDLKGPTQISLSDLATKRIDTVIRQQYAQAQAEQKQVDDDGYKQALAGNINVDFLQKNATIYSPAGYNRIRGVLENNPIAQAPGMANDIRQKWIDGKMTWQATTEGIKRLESLTQRFPSDNDAHRYLKELQDHYRSLRSEGRQEQVAGRAQRNIAAQEALRDIDDMSYKNKKLEEWYLGGIDIAVGGYTRKKKWSEAVRGMKEDIELGRKSKDEAKKEFFNTITGNGAHNQPDSQPGSADEKANSILDQQGLR